MVRSAPAEEHLKAKAPRVYGAIGSIPVAPLRWTLRGSLKLRG
ncbi:hypothetical protein [Bacillus sp. IG2]|nr:hypothetical protein [Bacillus sp. IG2]MDU0078330.1 hypothetical protein [Bacillus sp. IG2]